MPGARRHPHHPRRLGALRRRRTFPMVPALIAALLATGLAVLVAPAAQASATCGSGRITSAVRIEFTYRSGQSTTCDYSDRLVWLQAVRDAVVRGEHGAALGGSDYSRLNGIDEHNGPGGGCDPESCMRFVVDFHGNGASGYVSTTPATDPGTGLGYPDWLSSTKVQCPGRFVPSPGQQREQVMLRDFVYHVGEVAKTNSNGYRGGTVTAAHLVVTASPETYSVVYSPTSCPL